MPSEKCAVGELRHRRNVQSDNCAIEELMCRRFVPSEKCAIGEFLSEIRISEICQSENRGDPEFCRLLLRAYVQWINS